MGAILDRLKGILDRSRQLGPIAEPIRQILWNANRDRALQGVSPEGIRFTALKPRTLAQRRKLGYPAGPPLVRKGLEAAVIQGCVINVTIRDGQLRFTKSWPGVPYMEFHVLGTARMAKRDPMGWSKEELEQARALLPRHVLGIGDLPGSVIGRPT